MAGSEHPDLDGVQGHGRQWLDETLNQGIEKVESALAGLRELQTTPGEEDDVEGHGFRSSDENLKQAVAKVEDALASLRALRPSEGQARLAADKRIEQPIGSLQRVLGALRPGTV